MAAQSKAASESLPVSVQTPLHEPDVQVIEEVILDLILFSLCLFGAGQLSMNSGPKLRLLVLHVEEFLHS